MGNILQDIRNTIANFVTPNINSRGQKNLAYKILQPAAQAQRFIESPKSTRLVPQINAPKKANIGTQLGYGLLNVPGAVVNSVVGQGVIDPAIDVGRFLGNTLGGRPLPKYTTLKSGPGRLGMQIGSGLTGQKLAPTSAQQYIANLADTANPIISAYAPKGAKNVYNAATKTIGRKVLEGAIGGGALGGAFGLTQGLGENRNAETLAKQFLGAAPQALTGAALGGVLGGTIGGVSGIKDAFVGKTSVQLGISKKEAAELTSKYFRNDLGQFSTKDGAVTGLKKKVQAQINRTLGKPLDSPVFHSDLKRALGYSPKEEIEKRIGLQARPTGSIAEAQAAKDAAKIGKGKQLKLGQPKMPIVKPATQGPKLPTVSQLSSGDNLPSGPIIPPQGKLPVESQRLNVNNLNLDEAQKLHVQSLEDATKIRTRLGDKQVLEIADKAGIDTKTYSIDETAQKIAEQLNVRRNVVTLENHLKTLQNTGASQDEVAAVIKQIANSSRIATEQGTDIARQLSARRILANELDSPMQRIFKLLDKAGINPEVYSKKAASVDFKNARQVVEFYRSLVPPTKGEWIDAVRYNSMLSSPLTHIVNITSNAQGTGLITPVEKTITGGIDWLKSTVTGKPRQYAVGEGVQYVKGYYSNLRSATTKFFRTLSGKDLEVHPDMRNIPLGTKGVSGAADKVLNLPGRLLEGMDQFFTTLTEGGLNKSLAYRASKGIKVNNIASQVPDEAAYRLFRSKLGNPREGYVLNAIDAVPSKIMELTHSSNPVTRAITRLSFPFIRIGTNLIKQGIEYGPAGITTIPGALEKTPQVAKAALGTGIMFGTALLASSDRTTFAEPTGAKEKAAFRAAGKIPYAVKIGDTWVSYNKLHPAIAFNMAIVSALHEAQKNNSLSDDQVGKVAEAMMNSVNFWADQSYFKNIGDMVSGLKGGESAFVRLVGNYPAQFIPFRALMSWVERIVDPYQRQIDPNGTALEKQVQQIYSQLPGLANQVPVRKDAQGNPIVNQHQIINAISPSRVSTEKPEAAKQYDILKEQQQINKLKQQISDGEITVQQAQSLIAKQRPGFGISTEPAAPTPPKTANQLAATAFGKQFSSSGSKSTSIKLKTGRKRKLKGIKIAKTKKIKAPKLKQTKFKIAKSKTYKVPKFKIKSLKAYA